jgi:hypothetical protein
MEKAKSLDRRFETITWGLLLIWWGLRWWPLISLPNGVGLIGTGLILLGLNVVRSLNGIPSKGSTTIIGTLTLIFGGLLVTNEILQLFVQFPVFEVMLIGGGVILLARELLRVHATRETR